MSQGRPEFKDAASMSDNLKDFIIQCTVMNPKERPTATELLKVCARACVRGVFVLVCRVCMCGGEC